MEDSLLEKEFSDPFNSWKAEPSPENSSKLLKAVNPVLTAAIRTYGTQGSPTLHTRAKILALDAMKRYDPSQAKLRTHLMFQLQGLRRHTAQEQQILSVPEQVGLDINHLRESQNVLSDKLGRDPSDMELADHTGLSIRRLKYIRKYKPSYSESSFHRATDDGTDLYSPAVGGRDDPTHWQEFVYHDLEPKDQLILEHSIGLFGKPVLSNQAIAKKLRISPGAVSQRRVRIQQKLDQRDELGVI